MKGKLEGHQTDIILVTDDKAFSEALTVLFVLEQLTVAVFGSLEALTKLREAQSGCVVLHCEADSLLLQRFVDWHKPALGVVLISASLPSNHLDGLVSVLTPPVESRELLRVVRGACRDNHPSSDTTIAHK